MGAGEEAFWRMSAYALAALSVIEIADPKKHQTARDSSP
jgi:hypothetical protein